MFGFITQLYTSFSNLRFPPEERVTFKIDFKAVSTSPILCRGSVMAEDSDGGVYIDRLKVSFDNGYRWKYAPLLMALSLASYPMVQRSDLTSVTSRKVRNV
jgi:hypothetical protein